MAVTVRVDINLPNVHSLEEFNGRGFAREIDGVEYVSIDKVCLKKDPEDDDFFIFPLRYVIDDDTAEVSHIQFPK